MDHFLSFSISRRANFLPAFNFKSHIVFSAVTNVYPNIFKKRYFRILMEFIVLPAYHVCEKSNPCVTLRFRWGMEIKSLGNKKPRWRAEPMGEARESHPYELWRIEHILLVPRPRAVQYASLSEPSRFIDTENNDENNDLR